MEVLLKLFCIIGFYVGICILKINSSRDLLYVDIDEVDVVADQHIQWRRLLIYIIQLNAPRLFNILTLKKKNIYADASNIQITKYLSDVQEHFNLKFSLKIMDSKLKSRILTHYFGFRMPRSENGKCKFANEIFLETFNNYTFKIGINFKVCLMRYTSFSDGSFEAIKLKSFFHTYYGALSSDDCRKYHYKYSPQLKRIICLCQYNERPCDTFAHCVSRSKVCSDRGFCVTSKPFSKCECLNGHSGYHCEKAVKPCDQLPRCENNGTCINNNNFTWSCQCLNGFYGKQCEYIDYCFGILCYNKGRCINYINRNFKCICGKGFQGRNCEIELSKCPKCQNNGTCISPDLGFSFLCQCSNGSFGSLCEFQFNRCTSDKKCLNYGSCYANKYGRENCYCQKKYYGISCERYSQCLVGLFGNKCQLAHICYRNPRVCLNAGRCEIVNINSYVCQCKPGFHGKNCKRRHCTKDSDCLNGGSCDRDGSSSICICAAHFIGKFCQYINRCYGNYICNIKGQCILKGKGEFKECICNKGYYGQYCNKNAKLDRSEL